MKKFLWLIILGSVIMSTLFAGIIFKFAIKSDTIKHHIVMIPENESLTQLDVKNIISSFENRLENYEINADISYNDTKNTFEIDFVSKKNSYTYIPEIAEELTERGELTFCEGDTQEFVILDNSDISNAEAVKNPDDNTYYINIEFNEEGTQKFADATRRLIGNQVSIWLDDQLITAPMVNDAITNGEAMIWGDFSKKEAEDLSRIITSTPLPCEFDYNTNSSEIKSIFGIEF